MLYLLLHTVVFDLKRYSWSSELCYSEERNNNYDSVYHCNVKIAAVKNQTIATVENFSKLLLERITWFAFR